MLEHNFLIKTKKHTSEILHPTCLQGTLILGKNCPTCVNLHKRGNAHMLKEVGINLKKIRKKILGIDFVFNIYIKAKLNILCWKPFFFRFFMSTDEKRFTVHASILNILLRKRNLPKYPSEDLSLRFVFSSSVCLIKIKSSACFAAYNSE